MQNVHPVMAQVLAGIAPQEQAPTQAQYIAKLKAFDWHFEFSDSQAVWSEGRVKLAELHIMQGQIDPTGEIWMQHKPDAPGCTWPKVQGGVA